MKRSESVMSSRPIQRRPRTNLLVIAAVVSLGALLVTACGGEEDEGEDGSREASGFFSWLKKQGYETIEEAKAGVDKAIAAAKQAVKNTGAGGKTSPVMWRPRGSRRWSSRQTCSRFRGPRRSLWMAQSWLAALRASCMLSISSLAKASRVAP